MPFSVSEFQQVILFLPVKRLPHGKERLRRQGIEGSALYCTQEDLYWLPCLARVTPKWT